MAGLQRFPQRITIGVIPEICRIDWRILDCAHDTSGQQDHQNHEYLVSHTARLYGPHRYLSTEPEECLRRPAR
jgi:hypothetical protein